MAKAPPGYEYVKGPTGYTLAPLLPEYHRPTPRPVAAPKPGYRWVQSHGRWVQILLPKPKPGSGAPGAATPGAGTGVASATTAPAPATPAPIDPRDPDYQIEVGQAALDRDRDIAEQERQRATLPSLYNRGVEDMRIAYDRDRYDSNADLARRGIVRSGEYQRRGADRLMQQGRTAAGLKQDYGAGKLSQIAATLNQINQQYALRQQAALTAAKQRHPQNYVASPYAMGGQ